MCSQSCRIFDGGCGLLLLGEKVRLRCQIVDDKIVQLGVIIVQLMLLLVLRLVLKGRQFSRLAVVVRVVVGANVYVGRYSMVLPDGGARRRRWHLVGVCVMLVRRSTGGVVVVVIFRAALVIVVVIITRIQRRALLGRRRRLFVVRRRRRLRRLTRPG